MVFSGFHGDSARSDYNYVGWIDKDVDLINTYSCWLVHPKN